MRGGSTSGAGTAIMKNSYGRSHSHHAGPVDCVYHFSDDVPPSSTLRKGAKSMLGRAQSNSNYPPPRGRTGRSGSGDYSSSQGSVEDRNAKNQHSLNLPQQPIPPPPGLKNVGNSCYANAALQCLLSTALPHALLDERNAHIIRRHSFNRKLLISGSGSVDSDEEDKEGDGDSVFGSCLSGMTGLYSADEEDDDIILARARGEDSSSGIGTPSPAGGRRTSNRKKYHRPRDDATVGSASTLHSDIYHKMKKRQTNEEPSQADLLCAWLTQELTQITREYTTPPQSFLGEKRRNDQKSAGCSTGLIGSFFGASSSRASNSKLANQNRTVDPGSITRHVNKISSTLRPYQQEDAHEFFRSLLSSLTMNGQNARLSSLFDGLLESSVTCKICGKSSLTRDRYMDLSLDIVDRDITSLEDALAKFTEEELLDHDNMVTCSRCKVKRPVTKGLRLATAPTMLVINYKRFAYDNYGRLSRLSKQVKFPLRLELKEFMSRANRGKPPPYSLVAVLVHRGRSCDCGHYFAYVRKGQDWYLANDAVVTKVDVDEVLSAQAYVLVYEVEGMKEKHNFDCYSRYHRSFSDVEEAKAAKKQQQDDGRLSPWDFSGFANLLEACEVGLCGAGAASNVVDNEVTDAAESKPSQTRAGSSNTVEDMDSRRKSPKTQQRKTYEDADANDVKGDAVEAYYKRGRSHTPSRQNRNREKDSTNNVSMHDFEPRSSAPRRAKSLSRVEAAKSTDKAIKRYTKARNNRRRAEDLPPVHKPYEM
eukprot:scaffold1177_cov192-Alexandrium_tamarense.AAC.6